MTYSINDINIKKQSVNKLLISSCRANKLEEVKKLLSYSYINNLTVDFDFLCLNAAYLDTPDIMAFLLSTDLGKNQQNLQYKLLNTACAERKPQVVLFLIDLLSLNNNIDKFMNELLVSYCQVYNTVVIDLLLNNNNTKYTLNLKYDNYAAFIKLFDYENTSKTVTYLLDNYHLKNKVVFPLKKCFILACKRCNIDLVNLLLNNSNNSYDIIDPDIISIGFINACNMEDLLIIKHLITNQHFIVTPRLEHYLNIHKKLPFIEEVQEALALYNLKNKLDNYSQEFIPSNQKKLKI